MIEQVKIAVILDNGAVAILSFLTVGRGNMLPRGATWADEADGWWKREASDENIACEIAKAFAVGPQPTRYRVVADSDVPADSPYRDAWTDDGAAITHDMPKAREIHLRNVRAERAPLLDQLDRDWMKAFSGGGGNAKEIEAERQRLRDLPATLGIEHAKTVDDLRKLVPDLKPKGRSTPKK